MATKHSRASARIMISPAVLLLLGWMLIPLSMTVYFSFLRYNLLMPGDGGVHRPHELQILPHRPRVLRRVEKHDPFGVRRAFGYGDRRNAFGVVT